MKKNSTIDFEKIEQEVRDGFINIQYHPSCDLRIYNYNHTTQFSRHWTTETMLCRGLIVNSKNEIIARPFPKFFTYEQMSPSDLIWKKPFTVTAKADGSLGILYQAPDGPAISTRGSFTSPQAIRGTEILRTKYPEMTVPEGFTVLYEIILPENRIVVNYGGMTDLILLTVTNTNTGQDAFSTPTEAAKAVNWTGPIVQEYSSDCKPKDVMAALDIPDDGSVEGLVLRFDYPKGSFTRVKTKTAEYTRLHRILTGTNAVRIWEALRDNKGLMEFIEKVPDEFYKFVRDTERELNQRFAEIETEAKTVYEAYFAEQMLDLESTRTRAEIAQFFKTYKHPSILFSMLDGKDHAPYIWKLIRPIAEKPFREEI